MKKLQSNIDDKEFADNYTTTIQSIFDNAPNTHLFITGYPRFWNEKTDYCDKVSFKWNCATNAVLPLIKERRAKMNTLTHHLNEKIKSVVAEYGKNGAQVTYVNTDPYFEGHRFCEEGVEEPSYRNPDIWFFPLEYFTGSKITIQFDRQTAEADCQAIFHGGGDAGAFFACQIAHSLADGSEIDLSVQPNNVKTEDDPPLASASDYPLFLTRTFHPTKKGHEAYREAFFSAYSTTQAGQRPNDPSKSSVKCKGLQDNTYATRSQLSDLITNTYCPMLAGMSDSIGTGHYLSGTPEAVDIFAGPSLNTQSSPKPEQCVKNLHKILDECDTDRSANPMDWKAGGEVEVDGWTYSITTKRSRPSAPKRPSAWCQLENCRGKTGCTARLWGAGWLSSGLGHELREGFELQQTILTGKDVVHQMGGHPGIDVSSWGEAFRYEAIDKHEWTVTLQMDIGGLLDAGKIVVSTMRAVANTKDPSFLNIDTCRVV